MHILVFHPSQALPTRAYERPKSKLATGKLIKLGQKIKGKEEVTKE